MSFIFLIKQDLRVTNKLVPEGFYIEKMPHINESILRVEAPVGTKRLMQIEVGSDRTTVYLTKAGKTFRVSAGADIGSLDRIEIDPALVLPLENR